MNRIDRLTDKARTKLAPRQCLARGNPYLWKSSVELLDMMSPDKLEDYQAPEMRTPEWNKFIYALVSAYSRGKLSG